MAMQIRFVKAPTANMVEILASRMRPEQRDRVKDRRWDAVGLIQSSLPDMFVALDRAEKAANVIVCEVRGNCPQNLSTMAVFGDTSAVQMALDAVRNLE